MPEAGSVPGEWCPHCKVGKTLGCSIYNHRPIDCQVFQCAWLLEDSLLAGSVFENLSPDDLGIIPIVSRPMLRGRMYPWITLWFRDWSVLENHDGELEITKHFQELGFVVERFLYNGQPCKGFSPDGMHPNLVTFLYLQIVGAHSGQ